MEIMWVAFLLLWQKLNWTSNHGSKSCLQDYTFLFPLCGLTKLHFLEDFPILLVLYNNQIKIPLFSLVPHLEEQNDTSCCKTKKSLCLKIIGLKYLRAILMLVILHR